MYTLLHDVSQIRWLKMFGVVTYRNAKCSRNADSSEDGEVVQLKYFGPWRLMALTD